MIERQKEEFLAPFFTNLDKDVYALTDRLPDQIKAALIARQSRAQTRDARELLWSEFAEGSEQSFLDQEKAARKIKNIIDGFGDDSVREQASAYVMVQKASILATTFGFTHPLLTRIEASTRYIDWGEKAEGKYLYKELDFGADGGAREVYETAMELCFDTYRQLWPLVWDYVVANNPREEGTSEAAYLTAVRGRVCDDLRSLLPLATQTNFGLHGDFRSFSELVMNLRARSGEMRQLGDQIAKELIEISPEFMAVVDSDYGAAWTEHQRNQDGYLANYGWEGQIKEGNKKMGIDLKVSTRYFLYTTAKAYINSQNPGLDKGVVHRLAEEMIRSGRMEKILVDLGRLRKNRRHQLPDFLRSVVLKIRFRQISFGSLKDMFRHRRILWRSQPDFSGQNGFYIPDDLKAMGGEVLAKYNEIQGAMATSVKWMRRHAGEEKARYLLTQGMLTTFDLDCDLVEGIWISELRSIASGSPEYRLFAQQLWQAMVKKMPALTRLGSFTDMNEYSLGRIKEAVKRDLSGR